MQDTARKRINKNLLFYEANRFRDERAKDSKLDLKLDLKYISLE